MFALEITILCLLWFSPSHSGDLLTLYYLFHFRHCLFIIGCIKQLLITPGSFSLQIIIIIIILKMTDIFWVVPWILCVFDSSLLLLAHCYYQGCPFTLEHDRVCTGIFSVLHHWWNRYFFKKENLWNLKFTEFFKKNLPRNLWCCYRCLNLHYALFFIFSYFSASTIRSFFHQLFWKSSVLSHNLHFISTFIKT